MKKILSWGGIVLLGMLYLYVFYLGEHPEVNELYRIYFMEKKFRYYPVELDFCLEQPEYLIHPVSADRKDCHKISRDWGYSEKDGAWTNQNTIHLYFHKIDTVLDSYSINFSLSKVPNNDISMNVFLNGFSIGMAEAVKPGIYSFKFDDKMLLKDKLNDISVKLKKGRIKVDKLWIGR